MTNPIEAPSVRLVEQFSGQVAETCEECGATHEPDDEGGSVQLW